MGLVLPTIEAYHVPHLPIVQADADQSGRVEVSHQVVPTAMASDPGTLDLGMLLETLSGRRPLDRLAACVSHHATALLWGKPVAPSAVADETVGRIVDRL
jgi:hypothetical protein